MTTQIVEIPVSSIEDVNGEVSKTRKFSLDLDSLLNNDLGEFVMHQEEPSQSVTNVPQSLASHHLITRQDSNDSLSSNSSFYSLDFDDYQSSLLYNENFDGDLMSPLFPQSPSIDELSKNFNSMSKPNDEDVSSFRRSPKSEKVENNEESSESSGESNSDSDNGRSPLSDIPVKQEETEESHQHEEDQEGVHDPDFKDDDDDYRPTKKRIIGIRKNDSFSSIGSYSSGASDSEDNEDLEYEDEDDESRKGTYDLGSPKRYKQPLSLRADDLKIGNWSLKDFSFHVSDEGLALDVTFDIKILFGRRKIKYEICKPNKGSRSKSLLVMDFAFSSISGLEFKSQEQLIVFQLSEPPTFSKKEKGKSSKIEDFTNGNASKFPRHFLFIKNALSYTEYMEKLLSCDRRLRQLSKVGLPSSEGSFSKTKVGDYPVCDWDKDNKASKRCEECGSNFCDVCDDVIHRHESHKSHQRTPIVIVRPVLPPKPKKPTIKKRKKMNSDRCRCGTGATKGTLGEPCTGNRCPCFSNGKSCANCGCKNCANPIRKSRSPGGSRLGAEALQI